jgi:tRNA G18 (ribose-2'-O)-methylase SpoU
MSSEPISDLDDPRLAVYRSLKATNQTRRLDQFVVEGEKLVARLLVSRFPVVSILATDRFVDRLETPLPAEIPLYVVPFEQVHTLVGFPFHRGVLACGQRRASPNWQEVLPHDARRSTVVIFPQLSNPENLGAIARIGDVFGIDAILAGPSCPDPFSRRVLRVSMGSVLQLPVLISDRIEEIARELESEHQFELWAAVAENSAPDFATLTRPGRLGLVFGDEDRGVDAQWLRLCKRTVTIPMRPGAGSLNVSVAAGVLLHHLTRQPKQC